MLYDHILIMSEKSESKKRIQYIDTIKGLACLFIFLGHFNYGFNLNCDNSLVHIYSFQEFLFRIFGFFFSGTFVVSLFCIIAGYFTSNKLYSVFDFFLYSLLRYLRLALPLFFLCLSLFFLLRVWYPYDMINGLSNLLGNEWLKERGIYHTSLTGSIYASLVGILIKGKPFFDLPTWMLHPMLMGQIVLAFFYFVTNKFPEVNLTIKGLILFLIISYFFYINNYVIASVLLGGFLNLLENKISKHLIRKDCLSLIGVLMVYIIGSFLLPLIIMNDELYNVCLVLFAFSLILFISCSSLIKNLLNGVGGVGKIAFPVYLIHMPVITLIAIPLFYKHIDSYSYSSLYFVIQIICIIIVFLLSLFWYMTIDRICNRIIVNTKNILVRLTDKSS